MFNLWLAWSSFLNFNWEIEELPECRKKDAEKKVTVYLTLNMVWKLID